MTDATFYLAVACFALTVLSADRLYNFMLIMVIAFVGTALLLVLGIVEVVKALTERVSK